MTDLRELLQGSVSPDPEPVRPESSPESVWREGRARRRRRHVRHGALAAALLLLLALALVPWVVPARTAVPAGSNTTGSGYPQRISASDVVEGDPTWPVAGVLTSLDDWEIGLRTLDSSGHVRISLSDALVRNAAASADGTHVVALTSTAPAPSAADLTSPTAIAVLSSQGVRTVALDGPGAPTWQGRPMSFARERPVWSPDGRRVALALQLPDQIPPTAPSVLVVGVDGSTAVLGPPGADLAGWRQDGSLVVAQEVPADKNGPQVLRALDPTNGQERDRYTVRMRGVSPTSSLQNPSTDPTGRVLVAGSDLHVPGAAAGAEATLVALGRATIPTPGGTIWLTAGGKESTPTSPQPCWSWRDTDVLSWKRTRGLWDSAAGEIRTVVDPDLETGCLQLTSAALAGPQHTSWLGTTTGWLSWHWRVVVPWALVLGLLGLGIRASRRGPDRWSFARAAGGPNAWAAATHWRGGDRR